MLLRNARLAVLLLCIVALPAHVIDGEDRQFLGERNERIFAGVGKVVCFPDGDKNSIYIFSTGTLLGNSTTVFTVGHYRNNKGDRSSAVSDCYFRIYDSNGAIIFEAKIRDERRALPSEFYQSKSAAAPDWAILRLEMQVPEIIARPMFYKILGSGELYQRTESVLVGYHGETHNINENRRVMSPKCQIRQYAYSRSHAFFEHFCDTDEGSSGSLFYDMDAYGRVFAFAYNHGESDQSYLANYGQPLTHAHDKLIRNLNW